MTVLGIIFINAALITRQAASYKPALTNKNSQLHDEAGC
jgi:hypothetical protein